VIERDVQSFLSQSRKKTTLTTLACLKSLNTVNGVQRGVVRELSWSYFQESLKMNAMKKAIALATVGVASLLVSAQASAREFADIYTECGLGAMIAPKNAAVAAVTNVTWDLGTTAISSNISSADSCQGGKAKTAAYIFQSYAQLEQNLAQGQGEHLSALMAVAGCSANAKDAVATSLRNGLADRARHVGFKGENRFEQSKAIFDGLARSGACTV
jgi:Protein of unknown function (DUF3015)